MTLIFIGVGLLLALLILSSIPKLPNGTLRGFAAAAALAVLIAFFALSSIRYVSSDEVGIVVKNIGAKSLQGTSYIATSGEKGVQANVLSPGWHLWYWPIVYDVKTVPLVQVKPGEVGLIETSDGLPLDEGQVIAAEFSPDQFQKMLDATYFLGQGKGQKGQQASVLTPGKYRLNTELFRVTMVPQLEVEAGTVAVLKSNFGSAPSTRLTDESLGQEAFLAKRGEQGVLAEPLPPGTYPVNPKAYKGYVVSTQTRVAHYTASEKGRSDTLGAITVKSSDGFNFPVDVRVAYFIKPQDAPRLVALLGSDDDDLQNLLTSSVRAIFRDGAENVKALDYIQERSKQGRTAEGLLATAMAPYGVTVEAVFIGDVGSEETLGELLKTQRDREIAKQEQLTFQEQQRAAQQKRELTRAQQEAEEERRLATASYSVKIAEQEKERQIIAAKAESEAIMIKAEAQAGAFERIAAQIGPGNAALIEVLKIVGERNIQITPRVMIGGNGLQGPAGIAGDSGTTALIGTMLDSMISKEEPAPRPAAAPGPTSPTTPTTATPVPAAALPKPNTR